MENAGTPPYANQRTSILLAPQDSDPADLEHMDIEIVEGLEDDQPPAMTRASDAESAPQQVQRYPTRDRRAPSRFLEDFALEGGGVMMHLS